MKIKQNLILSILGFSICFFCCASVDAASKSKGLDEKELERVEKNVDELTKKIYSLSLFTPENNSQLVDIKTKLNTAIGTNMKDPLYARLFYDAAYICKEREYKEDAIQYFKIVADKFSSTAYSKRALDELKKLGVEIEDEEEEY